MRYAIAGDYLKYAGAVGAHVSRFIRYEEVVYQGANIRMVWLLSDCEITLVCSLISCGRETVTLPILEARSLLLQLRLQASTSQAQLLHLEPLMFKCNLQFMNWLFCNTGGLLELHDCN